MRPCLTPRCPELVEGRATYCPAHAPERKRWAKADNRSNWEWRKQRRKALNRDHHRCQHPGCPQPAVEVDHVIPRWKGGTDDLGNLQSLCAPHHRQKSEGERIAALRRTKGA